jgi:hypothetical protein
MRTSELEGDALDWAVAKCEGKGIEFDDPKDPWLTLDGIAYQPLHSYTPTTDWSQGGPIIEREWIEVVPWPNESDENERWQATQHDLPSRVYCSGPTPLIAAMRCYVASKLGDEVDVPDELLQGEQA